MIGRGRNVMSIAKEVANAGYVFLPAYRQGISTTQIATECGHLAVIEGGGGVHTLMPKVSANATPFEGVDSSSWLPDYYRSCKVLLAELKSDLKKFVGVDEAKLAEQLIASAADETAKAAAGIVKAHETVWANKENAEKEKLVQQAVIWATRQKGHRVNCPACGSPALVTGEAISAPKQTAKDGLIELSQQYLPNRFECVACGMKIAGHSQLNAVGFGAVFVQTTTYTPADFYEEEEREEEEHEEEEHEEEEWEEDNNEPMR
jgi:hypothetical protein